ncbi:MAG: DUF1772 domain-containing protein [Aureliella sp.]
MIAFTLTLIAAAFLNALKAGFLFAFAVVVMPGTKNLRDREFLDSFRVIDRVIQNNQPLFMVMWLGSTLCLVAAALLAIRSISGLERMLVIACALANLFLIQLPTMTINIPLNNQLQALDLDNQDADTIRTARVAFESKWNRWNVIRTIVSCIVLALLLVVLSRC